MINFDAVLFNETYNELSKTKSFSEIFLQIYKPFLYEIGLLWQTNSIKPIHEHFISYLIFQKLIENISLIQEQKQIVYNNKTVVLFLPENEVHEISLLFINYKLIKNGYKTIFLGSSVPFTDLLEINKFYENVYYISYFTIVPTIEDINNYLNNFSKQILNFNSSKLFVSGNQTQYITESFSSVFHFTTIEELLESI